jgi:hypothetical protein
MSEHYSNFRSQSLKPGQEKEDVTQSFLTANILAQSEQPTKKIPDFLAL